MGKDEVVGQYRKSLRSSARPKQSTTEFHQKAANRGFNMSEALRSSEAKKVVKINQLEKHSCFVKKKIEKKKKQIQCTMYNDDDDDDAGRTSSLMSSLFTVTLASARDSINARLYRVDGGGATSGRSAGEPIIDFPCSPSHLPAPPPPPPTQSLWWTHNSQVVLGRSVRSK